MESNTALVLGATGGIGGEMARQLRDAGWTVRALRRSGEQQIERRDAMNREDVLAAAEGCSVIVHAVNPPGYRRWGELVLPMLDNTIAAAHANGATIVLPGTVYNYGPSSFPTLHEDSPQQPITRKGSIRVEMEQRLKQASSQNCRVLLVRAGDFFGPKLGSSWFSQGMLKPGQPVKSISVPNAPGMGHQWSYLPDVARTMVELLQLRSTLDPFAAFHTAGHWVRRHPVGGSDLPRGSQARRSQAQSESLPLVAYRACCALCTDPARAMSDALFVEHAGKDEQRQAGLDAWA